MKLFLTIIILFSGVAPVFAQKAIKGSVKDDHGKAIESVNINLKDQQGNIISFTRSNKNGEFNLAIKSEDVQNFKIEASSIGYHKQSFNLKETDKYYNLVLRPSETHLETVTVKNSPILKVNGDTLNYKTSDFASKQDRSIGDVIKKMPGIEVSENGKISYNGKSISNLYVDGDNLLDDKYNIGTKSIPHGAVDQVQVIQNDQPIKMMRKNNMSDDVALNLVIKDDAKMKVMGDATAGIGTPDRFDENLTAMLFNKKLKFINNIKGNNIGIDPGSDLISHNLSDYVKRIDNNTPGSFLSTGAAGVPSLPQSRYLFNQAALLNFNNLYKFNTDVQLRANVSYLYDDRKQEYNKHSETYLSDQTVTYDEFQHNDINPQKLRAQFTLNKNAEQNYINNTLIVDYAPSRTRSAFSINQLVANQMLQQKRFDLSNELNYRLKLKSENVFNLYAFLNKTSQPETLNIEPGLNADILNNGQAYLGLKQLIEFPTWYANSYGSLAFVSGGFAQTYKVGFNIQHQQLSSALYTIQNDHSTGLAMNNALNDLKWVKSRGYTEVTYEYTNDQLKAGLSFPLSYNRISYQDGTLSFGNNRYKWFLNPSVNLKYQTGIEHYFTANYFFKNDLGGIDEVYQGIILKNYRSVFANNAPVSETKTHNIGGAFNFRRAMKMFFLNIAANYSDMELNTISSYLLSNNIQQRMVLPLENHVRSLTLNANASKYAFALKSTINLGSSYAASRYNQLQNGTLLPFYTKTMSYKAGIEAKVTRFLNWSYNAGYSITQNQALIENAIITKFSQLKQQSTIAVTLKNNIFINLLGEHLFTKQSNQPNLNYLFADANVKYRLVKLKTDLEFGITNLTNIKRFDAIYLSANSLTTGTYLIPGRVAMMKATFNF